MNIRNLGTLFKKSKKLSDNFTDLPSMLIKFPPSLMILRLAAGEGKIKFSETCQIFKLQINEIESGKRTLGQKRVERILKNLATKELKFNWPYIRSTFRDFNEIPKKGMFSKEMANRLGITLGNKRDTCLLGLKSIPMNELECKVFNILKDNSIPFERQALLQESTKTPKMIVIDFAIPNGIEPKIVIEATRAKFAYSKKSYMSTRFTLEKIFLGYRVKRLNSNLKSIIVINNDVDEVSKCLLKESFDYVLIKNEMNWLPGVMPIGVD